MDTQDFFTKLLPDTGVRFLARWVAVQGHPRGGVFLHIPFGADEVDRMAETAQKLSARGDNVYYAVAAFKEVIYKVNKAGKEYPAGRQQDNAAAVKAFWLDLDVGKANEAKSYPTARDAVQDVVRLCKTVGLPAPMLVSSGAGVHVYWPLTKAVSAEAWTRVARLLRAVCDHVGVRHDPACTTDVARVLRPIGTRNPNHGKDVRLLKDAPANPVSKIVAPLAAFVKNHGIKVAAVQRSATSASANAALMGGVEYPPAHADLIADHCAVIRHVRDLAGAVSEPLWYAALGLLKHTVEGNTVCHAWSEGHPGYDYDQCQSKIDQWVVGPTTCAKFKEVAADLCEGCPHTCKSPIQLGHARTESAEVPAPVEDVVPAYTLPPGFRWNGRALVHEVPNKDGVLEDHPFSDVLFYPVNRVRDGDGAWNLHVYMNVAGHYWREFDLPQMLIPDPRGLARHLAKYEIIIDPQKIGHVMSYMKDYTQLLMQMNHQTVTYDRFGWDEGKFIIGTTAFLPDGTTEPVLVTENVTKSSRAVDCTPRGDLATWVELIDKAYNRLNAEKYQFVIAAAFASPLVALANFDNYKGIPVVLSGEGGTGKSSVCKAAATIYAEPNVLLVDAGYKGGATYQGLLGIASLFNGVPVLFDEMTEREPKEFTPLMYSLSNGVGRIRMTAAGRFADTVKPFRGIYFGTSNNNVTDMIYSEEKKDVSDAASARCFEIGGLTTEEMRDVFADIDMQDLLEHQLFQHTGVAAQVYLPYVSKNRGKIVDLLRRARTQLGSDAQSESRERYYVDTIAFAHVAALIAQRLGLIKWNVQAMTKWAIRHMKTLRRSFAERTAMAEDNISILFSWLHGQTIVTKYFPSVRGKSGEVEPLLEPVRGKPLARIAVVDRKMFVSAHAILAWCKEYNQVPEKIRQQLIRENYILAERREYLGRGTNLSIGRSRVYEFNYDKVVGSLHVVHPAPASEEAADAAAT